MASLLKSLAFELLSYNRMMQKHIMFVICYCSILSENKIDLVLRSEYQCQPTTAYTKATIQDAGSYHIGLGSQQRNNKITFPLSNSNALLLCAIF